jgi:hypothetical protein
MWSNTVRLYDTTNPTQSNIYLEAFETGVEAYNNYLQSLLPSNTSAFSGPKLVTIIDSFAPALTTHLTEEIPSFLSLRRFGDALPLEKISAEEFGKAGREQAVTEGGQMFILNLDRNFEGGIWKNWPGIPVSLPLLWWCCCVGVC